jgi:hypothetical protein
MPIARITGQGLWAIAACVAVLWGIVIAQRVASQRVATERARVMQELRLLQQRRQPEKVSAPTPFRRPVPRLIAG